MSEVLDTREALRQVAEAGKVSAASGQCIQGLRVDNLGCLRQDRLLFRGLSFELNPGEVLHIQGDNGVGKSSLLRLLCGLLEPVEGQVYWRGRLTTEDPQAFHQEMGYLGHKLGLKDRLTVEENVLCFAQTAPGGSYFGSEQVFSTESALERLGLITLKNLPVDALSAGQKQRVAWARLLAKNVPLWLLDEPFTAVDRQGVSDLEGLIQLHCQQGGMVLFTSHQSVSLKGMTIKALNL